ncbi:hypothetical protein H1230_12690 [Paenibacillus sp. 19GGS1-52]|uniref:hypothetical protein n=1 Tax=Paenibacillus sp. 19GGS1-52 TaxID=2758563 RepID=UPI001EFB1B80|nr:hypothetical protein [Paenibacillus sp. 19GGS1-52]ULO09546.1 hypothetical protein H1230_12690 [Paenibacillus sp. 19GGS1-52]
MLIEKPPHLNDILENEMSSVVFIRDYIQLIFEEDYKETMIFTAFTLPIIRIGLSSYTRSDISYCNILCSLINQTVTEIDIKEGVAITLFFENNIVLEVSLKGEYNEGPEAAMFRSENGLTVW